MRLQSTYQSRGQHREGQSYSVPHHPCWECRGRTASGKADKLNDLSSDAGSFLLPVTACRLHVHVYAGEPLPELQCRLIGNSKLEMNFGELESKCKDFHLKNYAWKCRLPNSSHLISASIFTWCLELPSTCNMVLSTNTKILNNLLVINRSLWNWHAKIGILYWKSIPKLIFL